MTRKIGLLIAVVIVAGCEKDHQRMASSDNTRSEGYSSTDSAVTPAPKEMTPSKFDQDFAQEAAIGNVTEVAMGRVAVRNGNTQEVRNFGQRMIDDHSKAQDDLKSVARRESITIPDQPDSKHQDMVDHMSSMSGEDFDRKYVDDMVNDHREDIAKFENASKNANSPAIRDFASRTLPTLREHLKMIEDIQGHMGKPERAAEGHEQP